MKKSLPFLLIIFIVSLFFKDFLVGGKIPLPADTIVGMYHPWRDFYAGQYPRGIPFKNSLITDPVRQQYPWKFLAIDQLKQGKLPVWNPYSFSGTPLLANFQSGVFYFFNILFFIFNFNIAWGFYIYLQFLLGGIFMYLYLNNLNIKKEASLLGSLSFIFSGVFIAWGWWGNIIHTLLWLPLILLSIDKMTYYICHPGLACPSKLKRSRDPGSRTLFYRFQIKLAPYLDTGSGMTLRVLFWSILFVFSLCSSFFAGHLQVFFYVFLTTLAYIFIKIIFYKKIRFKIVLLVTCALLLVTIITSIQWLPTLHFINQSARSLDQADWQKTGWFLPWQNLVQFVAPDFFGNPATGNYWGIWNYGEFIGYIGVLPLILVVYALIFRKDKKVLFFGSLFFLTLLFALPTPLAKLPYLLKIPFISTSQPTRLLIITDFVLAVLSALGFDYFLRTRQLKNLSKIVISLIFIFLFFWLFVILGNKWLTGSDWQINLAISQRNLILPTVIFLISTILIFLIIKSPHKFNLCLVPCALLLMLDLFRFGWKFLPFTSEEYIYPKAKTIEFLQNKQKENRFRIMATDERIFPPNFSIIYKIESIDGYDPLFLKSYADLINKMEGREPNSSFNRIITPKNYESPVADLLNIRYVLSLTDISSPKLKKVFSEGETRVYENLNYKQSPYYENSYIY